MGEEPAGRIRQAVLPRDPGANTYVVPRRRASLHPVQAALPHPRLEVHRVLAQGHLPAVHEAQGLRE
jgi:hypothetical protein